MFVSFRANIGGITSQQQKSDHTPMTTHFKGDSVEQIIGRPEVAQHLGIGTRQLSLYIDAASLFVPRFKRLRSPQGGVSRKIKLTNWDLPGLAKVQLAFRKFGEMQARQEIAKNPGAYE